MPPQILMIDNDSTGVRIRGYVLKASGYAVTTTTDIGEAQVLLRQKPVAIVCASSLRDETGDYFLGRLRQLAPKTPIVALTDTPYADHAEQAADRSVLKLDGPKALLGALEEVLHIKRHAHRGFQSERVVFVDRERRYIDATEKACELVGYPREELLRMRIDDLAVPHSDEVHRQFDDYVAAGSQEGRYQLRHKDGHVVSINFRSIVLPDGCMAAEWEPVGADGDQQGDKQT